jgi:hypothetical protein
VIKFRLLIVLSASVCLSIPAGSQPIHRSFFNDIKKYDLSTLWSSDSVFNQEDGSKFKFPEPLGFVGDHFQRFYIHYLTVKRSNDNPYVYEVSGKTKVRDNICSFRGTITVLAATIDESYDPRYQEGSLTARILFREDSAHPGGGVIRGTLDTYFCLDKKRRLYYDAIGSEADGYSNNAVTATWTGYRSGATKKCNWGDFRIPGTQGPGLLDIGAGVFIPDSAYVHYGWTSYAKSYSSNQTEAKNALAIEDSKWWESR